MSAGFSFANGHRALLCRFAAAGVWWANKQLAPGFINDEDQVTPTRWYVAATPRRSSAPDDVCKEVEKTRGEDAGCRVCTTVVGYNLISAVQNTYSGFFFITLKPWEER